ncbi:hypothetical protein HOLleu_22233 [Holothuria leucospilota]|uniref:Uncharacterized protein n=1 Tax=Holothuria leucospilota TaxID=206669 RepID=A0A9Q1H6M1_HOLLE|nr:hypothetical protein HOLleu_22233 [Holothuria leucospilota]
MIPKAEKLEKKQEAKTSLVSATVTSADASSLSNVCATSGQRSFGVTRGQNVKILSTLYLKKGNCEGSHT